jgi:hypothetical protein
MRGFYTVFDFGNLRFGLANNIFNPPTNTNSKNQNYLKKAWSLVLALTEPTLKI